MERSVDDQWQQLADTIIAKAVFDYRNALRGHGYGRRSAEFAKQECERFFQSEWFVNLSGTDGSVIMEKLRKEYENERNVNPVNARSRQHDCEDCFDLLRQRSEKSDGTGDAPV